MSKSGNISNLGVAAFCRRDKNFDVTSSEVCQSIFNDQRTCLLNVCSFNGLWGKSSDHFIAFVNWSLWTKDEDTSFCCQIICHMLLTTSCFCSSQCFCWLRHIIVKGSWKREEKGKKQKGSLKKKRQTRHFFFSLEWQQQTYNVMSVGLPRFFPRMSHLYLTKATVIFCLTWSWKLTVFKIRIWDPRWTRRRSRSRGRRWWRSCFHITRKIALLFQRILGGSDTDTDEEENYK